MRKLFFYLIILKKVVLLFFYPVFEKDGKFCAYVRKGIENYLIFQPSKLRAKRIKRGLLKKISPQRFINPEGIKLYGWFIKPKKEMPVILHFHGQAESILTHQDIALYCLKQGYGLFMLSYRGHYKSSGKPSEAGVYNDAQAAINQLKKLGVDSDKIILWGHSLGTAVATETACKNKVLGVILQSPIKDIKSAAIDIQGFYCERLHLKLTTLLVKRQIRRMHFIQKMDNVSRIKDLRCPILLLHPKLDRIAPCSNSVELAELNPNSQLYISQNGNHWDVDWCLERVCEFIEKINSEQVVNYSK